VIDLLGVEILAGLFYLPLRKLRELRLYYLELSCASRHLTKKNGNAVF
jgi:hypothetical protein